MGKSDFSNFWSLCNRHIKKPCPECGVLICYSGLSMHLKLLHPEAFGFYRMLFGWS